MTAKTNLLLAVAIMLASCSSKQGSEQKIAIVKVDTVHTYGYYPESTFPGRVKAAANANLAFRISGTLLHTPVGAGDYVRKGQLIAEIDPRDYKIQVAATEAQYKQVKGEVERIEKLHQRNSVSQNDYEKAVYGLQQMEAKYNSHKNQLADTRLVAPFDGYVQKRLFEAGETVSAGMPVVSMIAAGTTEVEINIPSSEYIQRNRFESYSCQVDVLGNKVFKLDLIALNHQANLNQLYEMRFRLKPIGGEAMPTPGMATTVTIKHKGQQSSHVAIPLTALLEKDGKSTVWVYDPSAQTVKSRVVSTIEIRTDGLVVVDGGLTDGEVIVTAGVHSLSEGQKVKLLPSKTATNVGGML